MVQRSRQNKQHFLCRPKRKNLNLNIFVKHDSREIAQLDRMQGSALFFEELVQIKEGWKQFSCTHSTLGPSSLTLTHEKLMHADKALE